MKKRPISIKKPSPTIKPLRTATCPSLSGKSTLTYEVGQDAKKAIHFRVVANDGGGFYSKEWFAWKDIQAALKDVDPVTSMPLRALSSQRSVNTSGFVLSVLLKECVLERVPDKKRHFRLTGKSPVAKKSAPRKTPTKKKARK